MLKSNLPLIRRIAAFCLAVFFIFSSYQGHSQFLIFNSFKTSDQTGLKLGGGAKLTSGMEDPANEGWLRLTSDALNQSGYAYIDQSFGSQRGVLVEFEYTTWRTVSDPYGGADGITVFLFDATVPAFRVGAFGGSLGYAQRDEAGVKIDGLSGGYIGIGLDEFGNYSNNNEGRVGGIGLRPNSIGLRGPEATNYQYVTSTQLPYTTQAAIQAGQFPARPTSTQFYRKVQIRIQPGSVAGTYNVITRWRNTEDGLYNVIFNATLTLPPPTLLKLGFAASTGSGVNNHEIRNLRISTPGNVAVEQSVDKATATKGEQVKYTVTVRNDDEAPVTGLPLTWDIRDQNGNIIPASQFLIDNIVFNNGGFAGNQQTTAPNKTNPFSAIVNMEGNSSLTYTITGTIVNMPTGSSLVAKAVITPANALPSPIDDNDQTNNEAVVKSLISGPALTLTKTDLPGTYAKVGDQIPYTIVATNTGTVPLTNIVITDVNADAGSVTPSTISTLAVNATANITAVHTVTQADLDRGYASNLATAVGKDPGNNNVTASSTDPSPVAGGPTDPTSPNATITPLTRTPNFEVTKSVAQATYRAVGDVLNYTITVKNTGNVTLSPVVINDPLTGLNRSIASLAPGATESVTTNYTITAANIATNTSTVENTVTVTATPPAGVTPSPMAPKTAKATSAFSKPELKLTKTATNAVYSRVGDKIVYTLVLTNTGNQIVSNITITDANADPGSVNPATLASLAVGASRNNITATHTVTQADIERGYVSNVAIAEGRDPANNPVPPARSTDPTPLPGAPSDPLCATCTVTPVVQNPAFEITKKLQELSYKAVGDILHYTITVKNTGNVSLTNVVVRDPLTGLNRVLASLAPDVTETITTTYVIAQADISKASVENTATATANAPAGGTISHSATATVFYIVDGKEVFIPNVITPNGDGKNDQFRIPQINNYPGSELMIFNRWGNMVYRSASYHNEWDGKGLSEGTYYYALMLARPDGTKVRYAGWVQLLR